MSVREPTREQRAAIDVRGRDVLLEAGAGSGKTGVLVDRYCDLVATDEIDTDCILAFTFTDKAAAQLRERVRDELHRRHRAAPESRRLADLISGFGGTQITTIHGFCRRLLAAHPVAAEIDPRFRVLHAAEATRAAGAAFDAALVDFLATRDPEREATVAAYYVDGLRDMVVETHAELRSRGQETPVLPDPPAVDLAAAIAALGASAAQALEAPGGSAAQRASIERALQLCSGAEQELPALDQLAAINLKAKEGPRADCAKLLRAAVAAAAATGDGGVVYEHLRDLLGLFHYRYEEEKAARGGLDFEDLQLHAVRLLGGEQGEAYREGFAELMVDEFQDTNRLQLRLVEALRGPDTGLFLVGDEFQSIYGFRHADLAVFREQRERFATASRAAVLPLSGNFRSRPEVIATANSIGASMLKGFRPLTVGAAPDELAGEGAAVELLLTERKGWDEEGIDLDLPVDDKTPPEVVAEARFLAARLRALVDSGVAPGDVVLLLRAFTHVDAHEEALVRAGLHPYVVGGRGYWSQQQVEDVRCLLAAVANPLEDEPLLGALASPACGVLPDTLWILRRASGRSAHLWPAIERVVGAWPDASLPEPEWLEQIPAGDLERLRNFHALIDELRREGARLSLEELIERVVSDSGYDLAVLVRGPAELRLANVRKLMRMAREFEANEGRDLRAFLDFLAFRSDEDDESVAATEAEDHDGVRVMTIHAAKGLEFPVVAVAGLGRSLAAGRPGNLVVGRGAGGEGRVGMRLARFGAPSIDLYEREALLEEATALDSEEELRLFYVAATRARERLLLSGVTGAKREPEPKPSTRISERLTTAWGIEDLERDSVVHLPAAPASPGVELGEASEVGVQVQVNLPSPERATVLAAIASASRTASPAATGSPPIVDPGSPVTPRRPLSYSALASYERCGYRFYMESVLGLAPVTNGRRGADRGRHLGSAVHALLEWSARNRWVEPPSAYAERTLAANGLDDAATVERARGFVRGWIESELRAELAAAGTRTLSEVPFKIELGGSLVRGTLDLLARPREGTPTVVDYKTDRLESGSAAEAATGYSIQRDVYAVATQRATGAEGVRVAYVFLERPGEPVVEELGPEMIEAATARLESVIAEISAGSFEVTASPTWELCRDCPARRRLCSNPAAPPS